MGNDIEAIEVLTTKGRENIVRLYKDHPQILSENPNASLTCLMNGHTEKPIIPKNKLI